MIRKPKVTRENLRRAYKAETDAAWEAMSKRWARAQAKLEREMDKLVKAEVAAAMKPQREK